MSHLVRILSYTPNPTDSSLYGPPTSGGAVLAVILRKPESALAGGNLKKKMYTVITGF